MSAAAAASAAEPEAEGVEASYRRLVDALEEEQDRLRRREQQLQQERDGTRAQLERLRQDTQDWCAAEQRKIVEEWRRLDRLTETMHQLWPASTEVITINCSGAMFTVAKSTLCSIEGSVLSKMFSDAFIGEVPHDAQGNLLLDFNPQCFAILVGYLQNRRLRLDAPLPIIPAVLRESMEMMAEAWQLKPFLHQNRVSEVHGTSLRVTGNAITATHPGWQVVAAERPLPLTKASYFEVEVLANPDAARGGLAIGVCSHSPQGAEVHSIQLPGCIFYNSNNGLVSECAGAEDAVERVQLLAGTTFGIRRDPAARSLTFFHERRPIGSCRVLPERQAELRSMFPVFALYVPEQSISVNFYAPCPDISGLVEDPA